MSARLIASRIIEQSVENKISLSLILKKEDSFKNAGKEKALIQEMSYGTFRWYIQLEYILNQLLDKEIKKKDGRLKYLLLIGLYQLRFMRIPPHAVVSETVDTCKKINMLWAKGLVNAILRRYIRESIQIETALEENECIRTSHPEWLVKQIKNDWPLHWQSILEANNQKPPMYLRVNKRHQTRKTYLTKLKEIGIEASATSFSENGILLKTAVDVHKLPGFFEGKVSVQELAAQFSAQLLDLKSGQNVLDACAAPGGKSAHILETGINLKSLTCIEKDSNRTKRLYETLQRLKLDAVVKTADINDLQNWWNEEKFDRILLDAPCSATGVIRRHPDIKFLRTKGGVNNINLLQMELLKTLWKTLKSGGMLLYVTCSILKQENMGLIKQFINNNNDCELRPINAEWGLDTGYGYQILTGQNNMDGFFYACLKRK